MLSEVMVMRKIFPILLIGVLVIAGVSLALIAAFSLAAISSASGGVTEESTSKAATQLPKEKQTVLALYVTAKEAYEQWKAETKLIRVQNVSMMTRPHAIWLHP
jgi:hypothetical protein